MQWVRHLKGFAHEDDGLTAIEYALIASLIALAAITGITAVGNKLNALFTTISNNL